MKTSNRILLITGVVIAVFILAIVVASRIMVSRSVTFTGGDTSISREEGEKVLNNPEVNPFSRLEIQGAWEVEITRGSEHSVSITASESTMDKLDVETRGGTLSLRYPVHSTISSRGAKAVITMPEVNRIESAGGTSLVFRGFDIDTLTVRLEGATSLKGFDSNINNLYLKAEGATNVDCGDCEIVNAELDVEGAGSVKVNMAGGNLTGTVAGLANVVYTGEVSRQSIELDGLGSIKQR